jgi:hypothetical protein
LLVSTSLLTYTLTVTAARFSIPFEPLQLAWASAFVGAVSARLFPSPGTPGEGQGEGSSSPSNVVPLAVQSRQATRGHA